MDSIVAKNPSDKEMLMLQSDVLLQNKSFCDAIGVLEKLNDFDFQNTLVKINWSYALFMNHKPKKALEKAKEAYNQSPEKSSAIVNVINAHLWNSKTKEARQILEKNASYLSPSEISILKARILSTSGDFREAAIVYDSIAQHSDNSYYVQEAAEVLLSKNFHPKVDSILVQRGELLTHAQSKTINDKIRNSSIHQLGVQQELFHDIGGNNNQKTELFYQQGGRSALRLGVALRHENYSDNWDNEITINRVIPSLQWRISPSWKSDTRLELFQLNTTESNSIDFMGSQYFNFQANDRRMFSFGYQREVLNYTSEILEKNITSDRLGYKTHWLLTAHTGIFSEGGYAFLSDGNQQTKVFASVYQLLRNFPDLKLGVNGSYLHYTENEGFLYFAPNQFLSTELFAEVRWLNPNWSNFVANLQAAYGVQKIEEHSWEPAYRLDLEAGFRLKHFDLLARYQTSNVASSTGAGYQFDGFTFQLIYKFN